MATVEALPYETHQDEAERPLQFYLGDLSIHVFPSLLRAWVDAQVPTFFTMAQDAKQKTIRLAFKAACTVAMDFYVLPKARRGELPLPDAVACKADILGYSVQYWSDLIMMGLASRPWEILYVEQADGAIELTGLAPTAEPPAVLADASTEPAEAPATEIERPAHSTLGTLVLGGDDGQRENHVREATGC